MSAFIKSPWALNKSGGKHESGLVMRVVRLPSGTRGRKVAFQNEDAVRYTAEATRIPEGMTQAQARLLLKKGLMHWLSQRKV
jgi:hypothetical protein